MQAFVLGTPDQIGEQSRALVLLNVPQLNAVRMRWRIVQHHRKGATRELPDLKVVWTIESIDAMPFVTSGMCDQRPPHRFLRIRTLASHTRHSLPLIFPISDYTTVKNICSF
jgi:hypothetical protein